MVNITHRIVLLILSIIIATSACSADPRAATPVLLTNTPLQTAQAAPIHTNTPTAAAQPTNTSTPSVPPSATPSPTNTLEPTASPSPTLAQWNKTLDAYR